jgi:Tfp pilus assembly protein FimT
VASSIRISRGEVVSDTIHPACVDFDSNNTLYCTGKGDQTEEKQTDKNDTTDDVDGMSISRQLAYQGQTYQGTRYRSQEKIDTALTK